MRDHAVMFSAPRGSSSIEMVGYDELLEPNDCACAARPSASHAHAVADRMMRYAGSRPREV